MVNIHNQKGNGKEDVGYTPPYPKGGAGYVEKGDKDYSPRHKTCRSCVHFRQGRCRMVQGHIDEDAYCEELYADVAAFGHKHEHGVEENRVEMSDSFDWSVGDAKEFAMDIREVIENYVRTSGG